MTEPMLTPTGVDYEGIRTIQQYCRDQSVERGFGAEGDRLRGIFTGEDASEEEESNLRNYYANRLMLIAGEVIEAHEELRAGRAMDEMYYSVTPHGMKPEGVPSELADIVIRVLDLSAEIGIDLASVIKLKLAFNSGREHLHGKLF